MDDLIFRSFQNELSDLEERKLQNWRSLAPENERQYQRLARIWQVEPPLPLIGSAPPRPALEQIVREAERRRAAAVPFYQRIRVGSHSWLRRGAAAAALVLLGVGLVKLRPDRQPENPSLASEFVTGSGETATVTLTDGTIVRLAPNSRLRLPTEGSGRGVWLDGRAFFAVESDSSRPFIVRTRAGDAVVLGTRFELRTREDDLRLVVVEGRVALAAGGEKVEVGADEVSHVKGGAAPSVVKVDNVHELLEWPEALLIFQSTPLAQVGRELGRRFDVHFEFADSRLSERKVTGWFTDESLDEVLTAVCRASSVRCSMRGTQVVIEP